MNKRNVLVLYLKKYKLKYICGILVLFIVDILNLYIPQFTGEITDGLQNQIMRIEGLISGITKILIVGAMLALGRFLWRYFIFGTARKIEFEIRNDLFKHLESMSLKYFNENKTGDLMAHFTNDLNAVRMAIGSGVISAFDSIVMTILVLVKMIIYVDFKLTILAFIPLIFIAIGGLKFGKSMQSRFAKKQEAFSELTDEVQESISGIRVIKAFVQEDNELKSFAKSNKNNMDKNMSVVKLQAVVMPFLEVIIGISSLFALLYGGYLTIQGDITLGRFIAFNQYIGMLVWPMSAMGESINAFSKGIASFRRINDIFVQKSEIFDTDMVKDIKKIDGTIKFNKLSFSYPDKKQSALNDISIQIRKGTTLAILGRTGSGKTTIANLLLRLYNTKRGELLIDGNDILDIPLKTLRENIGYVPQDNFLFSDTLGHNISFGANKDDIDGIYTAAKLACIHDNIMDFPENYETMVGERGVTLSGGQKQRSSIARAIMKDAPILILDDALSAVDTDTEEQILANLKVNRNNQTTIIIAHRISTIQNADNILVLDEGSMAEYGTHEELIELNGIYTKMYEKQQLEKQINED